MVVRIRIGGVGGHPGETKLLHDIFIGGALVTHREIMSTLK